MAVQRSNGEVGGRSIEMAEKEFILRVRGYIERLDDLRKVAVGVGAKGVPILLGEVANVQLGPDMRRGIAELNGEGETVGGHRRRALRRQRAAGHPGREEAAGRRR